MWIVMVLFGFVAYAASESGCDTVEKSIFPVDSCVRCCSQHSTPCQFNTTKSDGFCLGYRQNTESLDTSSSSNLHYVSQCYKDCSLFINKKIPSDDCLSCTRHNPWEECYYVPGTGSCLSKNQTIDDGLQHIEDYYKTNQECENHCNLRMSATHPRRNCYKCTENSHCIFVEWVHFYPTPPPGIFPPPPPVPSHIEYRCDSKNRNKQAPPARRVFSKQAECLNDCENLQNSVFPIDTCVNCVSFPHPFCQYSSTESEGICERVSTVKSEWGRQRREATGVTTADYPIHSNSEECYSDCKLFINNKIPIDDCISCTRTTPSDVKCVYVHKSKSCYSETKALFGGLVRIKDYFKTNQECTNDCGVRIKDGSSPQENCFHCTQNPKCSFIQGNSVSHCVSKSLTLPSPSPGLPSGKIYYHYDYCLRDCSLSYREDVIPVENCLACTTFNFPNGTCAFKLLPNPNCDNESKVVMGGTTEGKDYALKPVDCVPVCWSSKPRSNS